MAAIKLTNTAVIAFKDTDAQLNFSSLMKIKKMIMGVINW